MALREVLAEAEVERIRAARLDGGEARHPVDPAGGKRLAQRLAERARVAEVAGGDDDPVGGLPLQVLQQLPDDRLLSFDAEGIDRVDQIDAEAVASRADELHGRVEIAAHLQHESAVGEGLGELAGGDLAARHEDNGA